MSRPKTITIFLKDSDSPNGIKIADLSDSIARVYILPRVELAYARTRPDLNTPAVYMLFDDERTNIYIGECENFNKRVIDHEAKKLFWQWAVVCIATGAGLDKAEVKFLESHAVTLAVGANRFNVLNKTSPNLNNLHEFKKEAIKDYFADIELLLATLGFNVFEPIADEKEAISDVRKIPDQRKYDTIVCPGDQAGYIEAFVNENAWWQIRIGKSNLSKLKYIAIYETAPVSAIRAYATITDIEPMPDRPGRYKIHHDGSIIKLDRPVDLGANKSLSLQAPRYFLLKEN
ncbi:hypothetical protein TM7_0243 [candidate division TM7 genomosp. GTL1]|nr:hypothetical protein TM7_0243 [candidate division TM7 genomosp. GTL1]